MILWSHNEDSPQTSTSNAFLEKNVTLEFGQIVKVKLDAFS